MEHTTTRQWNIRELTAREADEAYSEAATILLEGGTVAFPTETVYGLGADARNSSAVERIYEAKGRPSDNPLIVHIAERAQLSDIALPCGPIEEALMDACWPGPLTIVLPVRPGAVSPRVTAGLETVAVRMPAHPVALRLIADSGAPIAAPSANRSGRPSPTTAAHVREDLDGRIGGLIDGGPCDVGLESTVVEVDGPFIRVLRPGGVTVEQLRAAGGCEVLLDESLLREAAIAAGEAVQQEATLDAAYEPETALPVSERTDGLAAPSAPAPSMTSAAPRSPGMKYAHYAPRGTMTLVLGAPDDVRAYIAREAAADAGRGCRTGVLAFEEHVQSYADTAAVAAVESCGRLAEPAESAQRLYAALRAFDEQGVERIWAEGSASSDGIGLALMNRLSKAAGGRVVRVPPTQPSPGASE